VKTRLQAAQQFIAEGRKTPAVAFAEIYPDARSDPMEVGICDDLDFLVDGPKRFRKGSVYQFTPISTVFSICFIFSWSTTT
jgi:hypothetical protein